MMNVNYTTRPWQDMVKYLEWSVPVIFGVIILICIKVSYSTDIPLIRGIPELPGARPLIGHLHLHGGVCGFNDGILWLKWGEKLKSDLLQVRFGNRRVVVANSFDMVRQLFVKHANETSGRPAQYIFKKYIGLDLGTSSLTPSIKRQRTAGLRATQPRQWPAYHRLLAREGSELAQTIVRQSDNGRQSIFLLEEFRKISMNLAFQLTFGKRFKYSDDPWLKEYITNAKRITKVRGATATWIDFIPLLRLLPGAKGDAIAASKASQRREEMIAEILKELQQKLDQGQEVNCIASLVLQDQDSALTLREAVKCCMSMMQGGLETIPSHLFAGLGAFLSARGLQMQQRAFDEICTIYSSTDEAIEKCFEEEKVTYLVAMYKEMLRYYTIVPFSLPRETTSQVKLKTGDSEVKIPAGTYVYMNSEGGNHDPKRFGQDAHIFRPERWLENPEINGPGMPHYAYGVGSRVCPAWQISNRIMYGLLLRMIVSFKMYPDEDFPPPEDYLSFGATPQGVANAPKPFKIKFEARDLEHLKRRLDMERHAYED